MQTDNLARLRGEIDDIDDKLLELVEERLGGMLIDAYPIPQLGHVVQYRLNGLVW